MQRKPPGYASGEVTVTGEAGTVIMEGLYILYSIHR
ncbi:hypothetical protein [Mediterraneibacter gnavus]